MAVSSDRRKQRALAGAYIAFLLALLTAALLSRPERSIDFYAYYSALTWSARTGQSPYYLWNGDPAVPRESGQYAYSLRLWPGHDPAGALLPDRGRLDGRSDEPVARGLFGLRVIGHGLDGADGSYGRRSFGVHRSDRERISLRKTAIGPVKPIGPSGHRAIGPSGS